MKSDDEIIESLIAGGVIGAAIGALLSKKGEGVMLSSLIGATILGTYKANLMAKETKVPMVIVENGNLYQIDADGNKHFIKTLEKPSIKLKRKFKLT